MLKNPVCDITYFQFWYLGFVHYDSCIRLLIDCFCLRLFKLNIMGPREGKFFKDVFLFHSYIFGCLSAESASMFHCWTIKFTYVGVYMETGFFTGPFSLSNFFNCLIFFHFVFKASGFSSMGWYKWNKYKDQFYGRLHQVSSAISLLHMFSWSSPWFFSLLNLFKGLQNFLPLSLGNPKQGF